MKKSLVSMIIFLGGLAIGGNITEAKPVYNGQDAGVYFDQYLAEFKENGFQDAETISNILSYPYTSTKLKREILQGNKDYKDVPQYYLTWMSENTSSGTLNYNRPDNPSVKMVTSTMSGKRSFVSSSTYVNNQSQMMYPSIYAKYALSSSTGGLFDQVADWYSYSPRKFTFPQGFMYSEANVDGTGKVIKQFIYGKNANYFRLLWNPKTETMIMLAREGTGAQDKIMVVKTEVDEIYRYFKISGELTYFGSETKQFEVLNQMAYDGGYSFGGILPAFSTYGKGKGFVIPNAVQSMNLVIRTDVEGIKPQNWTIKSYPYNTDGTEWEYRGGTLEEASKPANFMAGFNADETGFESNPANMSPDIPLTQKYDSLQTWTGSKYVYRGVRSVNSVKMKSASKNMTAGESIIMGYGYEPTTLYKVPSIQAISDITKNEKEALTTKIEWFDQVAGSTGGTIEVYIGNETTPIQVLPYDKYGEVEGNIQLTIDPEHFVAGVSNQVKLVIKDSVYSDPQVNKAEHTSTITFKVNNERNIPIIYKTSKGAILEPTDGMKTGVSLMDGATAPVIELPKTMTDKLYPLEKIDPAGNANAILNGSKLTVKGHASLKDGITVVYHVTEVDAVVSMIEKNSDKSILEDIKNNKPLGKITLTGLIPGENLASTITNIVDNTTKLKLDNYAGYTRDMSVGYKILVGNKDVTATQKVVPNDDFEVKFYYNGEKSITKVPDVNFGQMNISNNSSEKYQLKASENSTVEMHDTRNTEDTKLTVSLQGDIKSGDNVYGGQLHYTKGTDSDTQMTSNTPILVMETKKDKIYNSVALNGSDSTKSGMYLVQDPGNYNGTYEGILLWKIVPDTVTDTAK